MDKICCICCNNLPESHLSCSFCNEGKYCIDCYSKLKCNCSQCSNWDNLFRNQPPQFDGSSAYVPRVVFNCENSIKSCGICRSNFTSHKQHKFISEAFKLNRGATYKNINLLNKIRRPLIDSVKKLIEDYDNTKYEKDKEEENDNIFEKIQDIEYHILGHVFFSIDHDYLQYIDKPISSWLGPTQFRTSSKKVVILLTQHNYGQPGVKTKFKKLTFKLGNKLKVTLRDVINFTDSWKFANTNCVWAGNSTDHHFLEGICYVEKNTIEIRTGS